uniref:Hemomucin n=1 Tax=Macrocentrus cingulum TaxID=535359 RepID=R4SIW6_9HYME|nr:hemomucin [Macrocentrus cingulum]
MGYLKSLGTGFVWVCTFLAAVTFIPGLPPNVEFSAYSFKPPAAINEVMDDSLNNAEKLFEGAVKGPECFDVYNGNLYVSTHGGELSVVKNNKLQLVARFGKKCEGLWEEEKCGRPLGFKIDKHGIAYVVDAYYGIFRVNVHSGKYEKIVDTSVPFDGKIPLLPNSVDVAQNGDLYWTVSTTEYKLYDLLQALLSNPTGRLMRYNAATKTNEVLIEDLAFANGVKLSDDESFVLVAETQASRVVKYHLKGSKRGSSEIFLAGLPGVPDNLHSDGQGNFFVPLVVPADEQHPLLSQSLAPHPNLRKMIVRLLTLIELPLKFLDEVYPNYYAKRVIHWIGHGESTLFMFPKWATVLRVDASGKVLNVLQNTDEKISGISSALPLDNYLYLGSPWNDYLARVPLDKALPQFSRPAAVKKEETVVPKKVPTTTTTTKPVTTTPKPTTTTPRPTTTTPEPTTTTPKPTTTTSRPTTTTPRPTTTTPKPTTTTPKPKTTPKFVPKTPQSETVAPKPVTTAPKPAAAQPTPTTTVPPPVQQAQIPPAEQKPTGAARPQVEPKVSNNEQVKPVQKVSASANKPVKDEI